MLSLNKIKKFVINLDSRTDRLSTFTKTFDPLEITRESAVVPTLTPELKKRIHPWNFANLSEKKLLGVVGCCMSHLALWRKIRKMKCDYVFVFEDDCAFINEMVKENFETLFSELKLPSDFEIVWLNGEVSDVPGKQINPPFTVLPHPGCKTTESYIITPSFADQLYHSIKNNIGAVDAHMDQYIKAKKSRSYKVTPPFFCQCDRRDTDIQF
jgi:GR25 family glycosyltransferase involved in LPS biosynthesis